MKVGDLVYPRAGMNNCIGIIVKVIGSYKFLVLWPDGEEEIEEWEIRRL